MNQKFRPRVGFLLGLDVRVVNAEVNVAGTGPEVNLTPRFFPHKLAQIHVGQKEDLLVRRDGPNDVHRVGGSAAIIGFALDGGGRVHVSHHHGPGVGFLPSPHLGHVGRSGQGAPGFQIREEDGFVRGKDGRGFGHEVHAAKDDDLGRGLGRLVGQKQGIPHDVGDVLNLRAFVIVGQNHGVSNFLEPLDFGDDVGRRGGGHDGIISL